MSVKLDVHWTLSNLIQYPASHYLFSPEHICVQIIIGLTAFYLFKKYL